MTKGDIVVIPFPYTDLSGNKLRPSIILAESNLDLTVCFITTQIGWQKLQMFAKTKSIKCIKKIITYSHKQDCYIR